MQTASTGHCVRGTTDHGKPNKCIYWERCRPEQNGLYQIVQEHLETFLAPVEQKIGSGLPNIVTAEFDAFPSSMA